MISVISVTKTNDPKIGRVLAPAEWWGRAQIVQDTAAYSDAAGGVEGAAGAAVGAGSGAGKGAGAGKGKVAGAEGVGGLHVGGTNLFFYLDGAHTEESMRQGLTLVHFSAQLELCLSHENTLHTLNTP